MSYGDALFGIIFLHEDEKEEAIDEEEMCVITLQGKHYT